MDLDNSVVIVGWREVQGTKNGDGKCNQKKRKMETIHTWNYMDNSQNHHVKGSQMPPKEYTHTVEIPFK